MARVQRAHRAGEEGANRLQGVTTKGEGRGLRSEPPGRKAAPKQLHPGPEDEAGVQGARNRDRGRPRDRTPNRHNFH